MKQRIIEILLFSLIGFTFCLHILDVKDFYIWNVPFGRPGTCYNIKYPDYTKHYQLRILANNSTYHTSLVEISLLDKPSVLYNDVYNYYQLRRLNAVRMECL